MLKKWNVSQKNEMSPKKAKGLKFKEAKHLIANFLQSKTRCAAVITRGQAMDSFAYPTIFKSCPKLNPRGISLPWLRFVTEVLAAAAAMHAAAATQNWWLLESPLEFIPNIFFCDALKIRQTAHNTEPLWSGTEG